MTAPLHIHVILKNNALKFNSVTKFITYIGNDEVTLAAS